MTRSTLDDPSVIDRATRTMALRKVAQVEDVARQILVLASDELSGHVTGQVVGRRRDGGPGPARLVPFGASPQLFPRFLRLRPRTN